MPSTFLPVTAPDRATHLATGAPLVAPTVALIARQAIVNAHHEVVGYELFNRSRTGPTYTVANDVALVFATLSHAGTQELVGDKLIFINCTHESLAGGHLELMHPAKVVLEIPPLGHAAADEVALRRPILDNLRQLGFRLAFNQTVLQSTYAAWLPLADYIKLDLSVLAADQLAVLISYAQRHSTAELIAEKVETAQQRNIVSDHGVELFQGYWFSRPVLVQARMVTPAQSSILALLTLLRQQAGTQAIEEVLKKDVGLAFNLLRLLHSSHVGPGDGILSLHHALELLGNAKLLRWAVLLRTASQSGGTLSCLAQASAVRGRLMELLATEMGQARDVADQALMVGLFSLLDSMLEMPMAAALERIDLPAPVRAALLEQHGLLGQLLALAQACEGSAGDVPDSTDAMLPLSRQQIGIAQQQATAWAASTGP